jgi:phosphate starvation-inducible PhoH-like protein
MRNFKNKGEKMVEQSISIGKLDHITGLFGNFDENIIAIETKFNVKILNRGTDLRISGETADVEKAVKTIDGLIKAMTRGETINSQNLRYLMRLVEEGNAEKFEELSGCIV